MRLWFVCERLMCVCVCMRLPSANTVPPGIQEQIYRQTRVRPFPSLKHTQTYINTSLQHMVAVRLENNSIPICCVEEHVHFICPRICFSVFLDIFSHTLPGEKIFCFLPLISISLYLALFFRHIVKSRKRWQQVWRPAYFDPKSFPSL